MVLSPGSRITLEDVRASMEADRLAKFVRPERLEQRDELPTTKVGKIGKLASRVDVRGLLAAHPDELPS